MGRSRYAQNKDFYAALGRKIALARKGKLTQQELADRLNLGRTSIVNIEKGRQQVLAHTLADVARELNTSPAELFPPHDDVAALLKDQPKKGREWILASTSSSKDRR